MCQDSKAKRNQAQQMAHASSQQKNKTITPDRLRASKQQGTEETAAQKQDQQIEKRMVHLAKVENTQSYNEFNSPQ
ncbi:hypothetical protein FE74_15555, partial [Staphylococcus aureus]